MIEGVFVPFDAGVNVTALAEQIGTKILSGLIDGHIWEDVTVQIKEAQKTLEDQLAKVEKARTKKAKK